MNLLKNEVKTEKYHPPTVAQSREFKAIATTENKELNKLIGVIQLIIDNYYIQTLTEYGLEQWEKTLDIVPWSDDTLDMRREAVEIALKSQLPYTVKQLMNILENICGEGGYKLTINNNNYYVEVLVSLGAKRTRGLVKKMLDEVLPMNLNYKIDLLYNRHIDLERYNHETMQRWTHEELCSEVLD